MNISNNAFGKTPMLIDWEQQQNGNIVCEIKCYILDIGHVFKIIIDLVEVQPSSEHWDITCWLNKMVKLLSFQFSAFSLCIL
jgi:hypothetical protein